jgi:parvulin-like peptidyl-prolyl isomerase
MRSPSTPILATLVAGWVLTTAGCGNAAVDRVATINGEMVTGSEFDAFLTTKLGDISRERLSDSVKSQLFDEFVRRTVTLQEARERGLRLEELEISARAPEEKPVEAEIASDLLVAKYYREVVLRDVTVTPEEVDRYYETHGPSFGRQTGSYVREIRVANREEADRLRAAIAAGLADFAEVARASSAAPTASRGGLSFYEAGRLPAVFERAIEPLAVGEVSPVVASSFGFHIFLLEGRSGMVPLERVRSEIAATLREHKNDELVKKDAERLLGRAHVDIDPAHLRFQYEGRFTK